MEESKMSDEELEIVPKKKRSLHKRGITEMQRTIALLVLLAFAIGFIYWTKNSYTSNFVDGF